MVWPDDVPPELAVASQRPKLKAVPRSGQSNSTGPRRRKGRREDQDAVTSLDELRDERLRDSDEGLDEPAFEDGDAALRITGHRPPPLRAVPSADESADGASPQIGNGPDDPDDPDGGKRKLPPYLRVIK